MKGELKELLGRYNTTLYHGPQTGEFFTSGDGLLDEVIALYRNVFGSPPWNEWAIKTDTEGIRRVVGLGEYEELEECEKDGFLPYYGTTELKERLVRELTGEDHHPFILLGKHTSGSVISVTYGTSGSADLILNRIGSSNYPEKESWKEHEEILLDLLRAKFGDSNILYIDETLIHPGLQGTRDFTFQHFEMLYQIIARLYVTPGLGAPIFYRTLRQSNMGKITRKYQRVGLVEEIYSHPAGTDKDIIFVAGTIPEQLVTILLEQPNIFSSLFQ